MIDLKEPRPHKLTPFARVEGARIVYPPEEPGGTREGPSGDLLT